MPVQQALVEWNENNRKFWAEQQLATERHLKSPSLVAHALRRIEAETLRGIPIYLQTTFEHELNEAEELLQRGGAEAIRDKAARGGRAGKADALQHWIEKIVRRNPRINCKGLLALLGEQAPGLLVVEVDLEEIVFNTGQGEATKSAPISGLKHRLTRARKKVRSRKPASAT